MSFHPSSSDLQIQLNYLILEKDSELLGLFAQNLVDIIQQYENNPNKIGTEGVSSIRRRLPTVVQSEPE